jgi:hypothetical protein
MGTLGKCLFGDRAATRVWGFADTVMCTDNEGAVTVSEGCLPCQ